MGICCFAQRSNEMLLQRACILNEGLSILGASDMYRKGVSVEQKNEQTAAKEFASVAFATVGWIELSVSVVLFLLELYLPSFFFAVGSMVMAGVIMLVRKNKRKYDLEMGRLPAPGPSEAVIQRNKRARILLLVLSGISVIASLIWIGGGMMSSPLPLFTEPFLKALVFVGWSVTLVVQANRLEVSPPEG